MEPNITPPAIDHPLQCMVSAHETPSTWDDVFASVCSECNQELTAGTCPSCGCSV